MNIFRKYLLIGFLLILSGCAGISYTLSTKEFTHKGSYHVSGADVKISNKESALANLGEPNEVGILPSGTEKWSYHKSVAWRGIAIWIVVPIPLYLPVGYNGLTLYFTSSGELTHVTGESGEVKGCVIFLLAGCMPDTYV